MPKKNNSKEVRVRFAPSPTGFIHIGSLRTVLFGYLIARKYEGNFILRIEDTDQKREVEGALEQLLQSLQWTGLEVDEGVMLDEQGGVIEKGDFGPYIQSQRLEIYQKYAHRLVEEGKAYHCFCSAERLDQMRQEQQKAGLPPKYDRHCLSLPDKEVRAKLAAGEKSVIRLKVPGGKEIELEDLVYGKVVVQSEMVDDQVLLKSDGFPTYHLAVVVDDQLMQISHVVRGEDWLPSAPKHVLLYEFLFPGEPLPQFVHVPNVVGENRKKLSKRRDSVSVEQFRQEGYLSEALINFLALLGWNPGEGETQEIFSLEELIKRFDETKIHRAGAVFDRKKLDWINSHYLREKSTEQLRELTAPYFEQYLQEQGLKAGDISKEQLDKVITIEKERATTLAEFTQGIDFYFQAPDPEAELIRWKKSGNEEMQGFLQTMIEGLRKLSEEDFEDLEKLKNTMFELAGQQRGEHLHPTRTALSGQKNSPGPFEIAWVIGEEEVLRRLKAAKKLFE
jgi:nondiscriminating glutamyl-tRNA synthetase